MAAAPPLELSVFSEIAPLREVLVHAPGPEVDTMPPDLMRELLFDDIVHGRRARLEHRQFVSIMKAQGVVVHDIQDLLEEAIQADEEGGAGLVRDVAEMEDLDGETAAELRSRDSSALAAALIQGLPARPEEMEPDYLFRLPPLPNLLFSRDAQVVIERGVVVGAMCRRARQREPLLSRFVFTRHPRLREQTVLADFQRRRPGKGWQRNVVPTLEGGDVLVFEEGLVLVGVSERTMERAVDLLADRLRRLGSFHTLILVPLPRTRSVMHLDTIFTRISHEECLVHAPMILPNQPETLSVISVDLEVAGDWGRRHPSLLDALRARGVRLEPICCGGESDYIQQSREQWTDGANSFALAPGVIFLYSRNEATAEELSRHGYRVLGASDVAVAESGGRGERLPPGEKVVILLPGEELSRARGGPRCMTMPLVRAG